jgi:hypothetical protein
MKEDLINGREINRFYAKKEGKEKNEQIDVNGRRRYQLDRMEDAGA